MKKVLADWVDTSVAHGWACADEVNKDDIAYCQSVGFLYSQSDDKIVLVMGISNLGNYFERKVIPTACVRSIKELRLK